MVHWFKDRLGILHFTLRGSALFFIFGLAQGLELALAFILALKADPRLHEVSGLVPWYGWGMGWLAVLWLSSLEYSVGRKKHFDQTSLNFFRSFLDFLLRQGNLLFDYSDDKKFYLKIKDWQQQAIQGIAIGLGPEESQKFFQKMETLYPVMEAYKKSLGLGSNEALCLALKGNLDELGNLRANLRETLALGAKERAALQGQEAGLRGGKAIVLSGPKREP